MEMPTGGGQGGGIDCDKGLKSFPQLCSVNDVNISLTASECLLNVVIWNWVFYLLPFLRKGTQTTKP